VDENGNPYRPGAGTRPPQLTGRDELLRVFRVTVHRALRKQPGQSMLVTGLRGVGKTVLLREFMRIAEGAGCIVVSIEPPENERFIPMLGQALRSALLKLDEGPVSKLVTRALGTLKSFSVTEPHGFKVAIDIDPEKGSADSGQLDLDLADLFVALGEAAADRKTGIVLAVDEIQYLTESDFGALIAAIHRTVQSDLPVVLVGAGLPQLPALAGKAKSYAERLFTFPRIGALDRESSDEAVLGPARDLGVRYAPAALEEIFRRTQGYPYFLQEYAYAVWNAAPGPALIALADVAHAAPIVERKLNENFFSVRIEQLTAGERRYLEAMAELGDTPYGTGAIAKHLGATQQRLGPVRQSLIDKGIVYATGHGELAFTVPLFDEFLRGRFFEES
jgi:AAA ATPase domain